MSKKRFTETAKWKDKWFMELNPTHKLFYLYILDECDNCGVWEPNFALAQFMIGLEINEEEILQVLQDKIWILDTGRWLIPKFIKFQYGKLNPKCKPHLSVIRLLEKHNLRDKYKQLINSSYTLQEEDKEKEVYMDENKDKKKDEDIRLKDIKIINQKIDLLHDIGNNLYKENLK